MTKEAFDNQKWYKNMPVWANGQKCYVREVRFMTGEINVIYKIGATSGVTWDFCLVETSPPEPTALDLISAEKHELEKEAWYNDGVVIGLRICKELWAQGTISHELIRENELHYLDELKSVREKIENLQNKEQ